jgi:hypothetical protein
MILQNKNKSKQHLITFLSPAYIQDITGASTKPKRPKKKKKKLFMLGNRCLQLSI